MSNSSNDAILDRASDVLETCDEATAQLIKRCVDNMDLDGLAFVLDHLPEEDETETAQDQIDHDADMWEANGEAERIDTNE